MIGNTGILVEKVAKHRPERFDEYSNGGIANADKTEATDK